MKNQIEPVLINEEYLKDKIYIIRGQKVMLDSDLAQIYGYTTSQLNRQVQRNIEKFDKDFMFQLNSFEYNNLMSQNAISSWGGVRKLPFVFTEKDAGNKITTIMEIIETKQYGSTIKRLLKNPVLIIK